MGLGHVPPKPPAPQPVFTHSGQTITQKPQFFSLPPGSRLKSCTINEVRAYGVDANRECWRIESVYFEQCFFISNDFNKINFKSCDFVGCEFRGVSFNQSNFFDSSIVNPYCEGTYFAGAKFYRSEFLMGDGRFLTNSLGGLVNFRIAQNMQFYPDSTLQPSPVPAFCVTSGIGA